MLEQGQGTTEIIIETTSVQEMTSWLKELKCCISPSPPAIMDEALPERCVTKCTFILTP
ncbi:hypothetical protein DPMN_007736 [Dreissena polymorpha]|uniref:PH domain-containing protein n=1 Tax=Dreissena polymorpha TaxID=45954 RepID=A0A9D4RYM0_DREPO|nr:hypothetical protein DPMN_007736 [Dreissena polymorpha]